MQNVEQAARVRTASHQKVLARRWSLCRSVLWRSLADHSLCKVIDTVLNEWLILTSAKQTLSVIDHGRAIRQMRIRASLHAATLRHPPNPGHIAPMSLPSVRTVALLCALAAGSALGLALASEYWGGLVPCALCLLERWPYRIAIALALLAVVVPRRLAHLALLLVVLSMLASTALAVVHVGVEQRYWSSPLPECAAPRLGGGSIAQRLAQMPARPAKPCEDATYLIPGLPVSMAAMNLLYALVFAIALAAFLWRDRNTAA
jgi:disulfide bond formation protein DsbB